MKVIVPGHTYEVANFESGIKNSQTIQFIHKEPNPSNPSELETFTNGTTNEELLAVLIDRIGFLDNKFPCEENKIALEHITAALGVLNERTAKRKARNVEGKNLA